MSPNFADLGVPARLVSQLRHQGILSPFPIQAATLPDALAGRDVCGKAPTGSGKTIAFGIAVLETSQGSAPRRPRGLVLVPTRELASQVQREIAGLAGDRAKRVIAVYGGTGYTASRRALDRGTDIVVACPGRLEDLLAQKALSLQDVRTVVLDEADRMADMGFLPVVRRLLEQTSSERQVLLFSATIDQEVQSIIAKYQRDPVRHDVVGDETSTGEVAHLFWKAEQAERVRLTARLVGEHGRALVFCRTRRGADRVARQLDQAGVRAVAIHGDRTQAQRERALDAFTAGRAHALVATDVASRGIHVEDLPCVVHFDPPGDVTDYLHRSGRTGRAGKNGTVVSLVTEEHKGAVRAMQRQLGLEQSIETPGTGPTPQNVRTLNVTALGDRGAPAGGSSRPPKKRHRHQPGRTANAKAKPARRTSRTPQGASTRGRVSRPHKIRQAS